ncbi:MAG: hypothetical protein CMI09_09165 [Oceanospirillaceae bacterium]|nr:hypothetical protein [Oceanospirillaceae bacterium]
MLAVRLQQARSAYCAYCGLQWWAVTVGGDSQQGMLTMTQLRPCPLCGNDQVFTIRQFLSCYVWCPDCSAEGSRHLLQRLAIKHWNSRTTFVIRRSDQIL